MGLEGTFTALLVQPTCNELKHLQPDEVVQRWPQICITHNQIQHNWHCALVHGKWLAPARREFCAPLVPQILSSYISIKLTSFCSQGHKATAPQVKSLPWTTFVKCSLLKKYGLHFQNILKTVLGWRTALYKSWSCSRKAQKRKASCYRIFYQITNHTPKALLLCNFCNWAQMVNKIMVTIQKRF